MLFLAIADLQHISKSSQQEAGSVSLAIQTNAILLFSTDDQEGELEALDLWQAWSTLHIWNRI